MSPSSLLLAPRLLRWLGYAAVVFLVIMSAWRAAVLWFAPTANTATNLLPAFWLGVRFDARVVAAVLLPMLIVGSIPALNPFRGAIHRRIWLGVLGLMTAVLLVFYISDLLHLRYLGQRLNASALGFLSDANISAQMVWETYPVPGILTGLVSAVVAIVFLLGALYRRVQYAAEPHRRSARVAWLAAAVLVGALVGFGRLGQYPLRWSDAFNLRNEASAQLALNPFESFLSSFRFRDRGFAAESVHRHYPAMSAYLGVTSPDATRLDFDRRIPARPGTPVRRPNIVLVLCESFSGYKSSMWGNPLDTTPFFAGLAREGVFFDNCFTPHFGTARGVWATITGTPDVSPTQTASRNPAMVNQHTIISDFTDYKKLYFLGGSSSWANIRGLLTNNIPDLELYEENSYKSPRSDVWGISDKNLLLEAEQVLRRQTEPFFAIIQTAGNHRPYTIPSEDLGEFTPINKPVPGLREHGFESLAELNAFRYTDYSFQKFFAAARSSEYFDHTIFVFIGDHGIGGNAGSRFPAAWTEQHLARYHVPLLFYAPKLLVPQRIHSVASMVDVLPTIAGLAGIAHRNRTFGRDLLRQQQIDGGASNVAFIMDHNDKTIGVVHGSHYGVRRLDSPMQLVWADFAATATDAPAGKSEEYRSLADAFHETARYVLLNNSKRPTARTHAAAR